MMTDSMDTQQHDEASTNDSAPTLTVLSIHGRPDTPYPQKELKDLSSDEVFVRRRLKTFVAPGAFQPEERANFIPGQGLVGHWFYHNDQEAHGYKKPYIEERSVLMQSVEHYRELMYGPVTSEYYAAQTKNGEVCFEESIELIIEKPTFGEQIVVRGCDASQLAIGDIFEVAGGYSSLKLEVASPRLPCAYIDRKHDSPFGSKGVKRYTMTKALAGWFCRVITEGELLDGMQLVRTSHPHPKWNLSFVSRALYAEGDRMTLALGKASWERDIDLLRELCNLPQLGNFEWGDEAREILQEKEKSIENEADFVQNEWNQKAWKEESPEEQSSFCGLPEMSDTVYGAISACACVSPLALFLFDWNSYFQ